MRKLYSFWCTLIILLIKTLPSTAANASPITHYSADYASAKWCYLSINSGSPSHLQYIAGQDYISINTTNRPSGDGYLWAFIGSPEAGFKIVNKLAGSTKILASPDVDTETNTGGSTYPIMVTETGINTKIYNTTWNIVTDGMGILIAREGETIYMNNRGNKLAYWTNHDAGSRIMISPANETLAALTTPNLSPTGKTYMLVNRYTGKALGDGTVTISNTETHVGTSTSVTGNPYDNNNVMWTLTADGTKWTLTNKATNNKLQRSASSGYLPINSNAASYHLRETGDGYYYLLTYTSVGTGDSEKIALNDNDNNCELWMASGLRAEWELRDVTPATSITSGHYYRLHNVAYNDKTMRELYGKLTTEVRNSSTYSQIWKITTSGGGYALQNALTGNYIQATPGMSAQFSTGGSSAIFYSHTGTQNGYTTFAFDNNDNGHTSLHCASSQSYNIVGWTYNADASYWYLEEVSLTEENLATCTALRSLIAPIDGNYYKFTNSSYTSRSMADGGGVVTTPPTAEAYTQIWKVKKSGNTYALQSAMTDKYIQSQTSTSEQYQTGAAPFYFNYIAKEDGGVVKVTFQNPSSTWYGLHSASTQSYNVVGWDYNADASWWTAKEVSVDATDLSNLKASLTTSYTTQLETFFDDTACTKLKATYKDYSDSNLRSAMSALPTALQDMAVAVKNNVWIDSKDATWNEYEKKFRIHNYEIYSSNILWKDITGTGPFARLTQPTGITASPGDILHLFVGSDVKDSDASLQAELVMGIDRSGVTTTLHQGHNTIYVDCDCEVFITYMLNNTEKSCNDYPNITVHIEGGTCNGCFDMHRGHTNSDWAWLKTNMFKDEFLHVKGESTLLNCYRERVISNEEQDVEKIMKIWDFVFDNLQSLAGCNQWKSTGRYKMMTNNFDATSGNPHWSNSEFGYSQPGIYHTNPNGDEGIFNAHNLSNVGTEGGQIWVIMHELGHGHQTPITLSGQKESSNNSLAQCVNFLTANSELGQQLFSTTRSSRGQGVKQMVENFNQSGSYSWIDYAGYRYDKKIKSETNNDPGIDIWTSNRFIFQLWLYFDYMGNYPQTVRNEGFSFITALYDALRNDPLEKSTDKVNPKPATKDYLKLAQKATEITETDLSEFFEAWGFWKTEPTISRSDDDASNKIWEIPDYSTTYIQTSAEQVSTVKSSMTGYTKKAGNIMFLEDRGVGSSLDTYNGAETNTFGDVGYYGSYDNKVTTDYTATVNGTTITMSGGTGAVGFKVYDGDGNLVAISNTNTFTVTAAVAAGVDDGTYTVKVAQGDGRDYIAASTNHTATHYECNIPYILKFNNTEIARENAEVTTGNSASNYMPSSLSDLANGFSDWITYTYNPTTITDETTEVEITAKWNGPFQISDNFASAKWYTVGIRSDREAENHIWKYDNNTEKITTEAVATNDYASLSNNHLFCFVGNPYQGFNIYNKTADSSKTIYKSDDYTEQAYMATVGTKFLLKASVVSGKTPANGYACFQVGNKYLSCEASESFNMYSWYFANASCTCWFIAPGQYYLDFIDGLNLDAPIGAVGSSAHLMEVSNPTAAKSNLQGYRTTISENMNADVSDPYGLGGFNGALNPFLTKGLITLGTGYWRIVNAQPRFEQDMAIFYNSGSGTITWAREKASSAVVDNVFKLTANGEKYNVYSCNAQKYMVANDGTLAETATSSATISSLGSAQFNINLAASGAPIHPSGHNTSLTPVGTSGNLISWGGDVNEPSAWYIVKADKIDIALNDGRDGYEYATMYMPFDVTISGTDAYTLTVSGDYAVPHQLDENKVPAGTGVLLRGTSNKATATINTGTAFDKATTALTGTYVSRQLGEKDYVLGFGSEGIGFYKLTSGKSLGANKAYLPSSVVGEVKGFILDWSDADGIRSIDNEDISNRENEKVIYNLAGQRIGNSQFSNHNTRLKKGIYIVNGKKIIIK